MRKRKRLVFRPQSHENHIRRGFEVGECPRRSQYFWSCMEGSESDDTPRFHIRGSHRVNLRLLQSRINWNTMLSTDFEQLG